MRTIILTAVLPSLAMAGAGIGIKFDPRFVCEVDPNAPPPPSRSPTPSNTSVAPSTTMPPITTTTVQVIETSAPAAVAAHKPNAACRGVDAVLTAVVVVALGVAAAITMF